MKCQIMNSQLKMPLVFEYLNLIFGCSMHWFKIFSLVLVVQNILSLNKIKEKPLSSISIHLHKSKLYLSFFFLAARQFFSLHRCSVSLLYTTSTEYLISGLCTGSYQLRIYKSSFPLYKTKILIFN